MSADLLLVNGLIRTPTARGLAPALAVANGKILAIGDNADVLRLRGAHTEMLDLRGRLVLPAFRDAHTHFCSYALRRTRVNLEGARSEQECAERVAARVLQTPAGEWIRGQGWNHLRWDEPHTPSRHSLDAVAPAHPVALTRQDGHSMWLNTPALRALGITRDTPDPRGGVIERDAGGEPTGILRENATVLITGHIGDDPEQVPEDALLVAIREAYAVGLTCIHDMEGVNGYRAFQQLREKDKLKLRVNLFLPVDSLEDAMETGAQIGLGENWFSPTRTREYDDEFLTIKGVKMFADGSLGSQTALMLEPFEGTDTRGVNVTPFDEIERVARAMVAGRLSVAVHAIGDAANRRVLDIYERLRAEPIHKNALLRIEHTQHLSRADIPRFGKLRITASVQPIHCPSDYQMVDAYLGARGAWTYAFRSLRAGNAPLLFGSDTPVESFDPRLGIFSAITRQRADGSPEGGWNAEQRLTLDEALTGYVETPLVEGAPADIVVLVENICADGFPPGAILTTPVDYTIVDGEIVYAR
jgi:predicted amidohydrolase YtcJ